MNSSWIEEAQAEILEMDADEEANIKNIEIYDILIQ